MNTISVEDLLGELAAAIYDRRLGYVAVTGTLTDWRRHRHGAASGELVAGNPPIARLRVHAAWPAAAAIAATLAAAGHAAAQPTTVIARGQVVLDRRWGLQLEVGSIDLQPDGNPGGTDGDDVLRDNHRTRWPEHVDTIGLIDPIDGDDARTDVIAVLGAHPLTVIEHRVPVTGAQAAWRISRALDVLAGDDRPDVTMLVRGGGADIDLAVFNDDTVAAAIARHPRPVITGIGHATNSTAADKACYLSCITPTAAALAIITSHGAGPTTAS